MNNIKQIVFAYDPGYLSLNNRPTLEITINSDYVTYHPIYTNSDGSVNYGVFWQSDTNLGDYEKLVSLLDDALKLESTEETTGTHLIVAFEDGSVKEKRFMVPFVDLGLNELRDVLVKMLQGLELPGFLLDNEE